MLHPTGPAGGVGVGGVPSAMRGGWSHPAPHATPVGRGGGDGGKRRFRPINPLCAAAPDQTSSTYPSPVRSWKCPICGENDGSPSLGVVLLSGAAASSRFNTFRPCTQ
eukprot:349630-Chlamydomonas_euryale.AAC.1